MAAQKTSTKVKGIEIKKLKEILLGGMIPITNLEMDKLVDKIDHRHPDQINWTEF